VVDKELVEYGDGRKDVEGADEWGVKERKKSRLGNGGMAGHALPRIISLLNSELHQDSA